MRLNLGALACCLLLVPTSALADWAVVQQDGNGQPYIQRFRSVEMARDSALAACEATHGTCRTVITGGSGCVATATSGAGWGVAKAGSQSRADAAALTECESLNSGACRVDLQFCGQ